LYISCGPRAVIPKKAIVFFRLRNFIQKLKSKKINAQHELARIRYSNIQYRKIKQ